MGNLADDHDAAIEFVVEEYRRLYSHNPDHDLLKYIDEVSDDGFIYSLDEAVKKEFFANYAKEPDTPIAAMLSRYYLALRNAVDKIEGIDRSPKKRYSSNFIPTPQPHDDDPDIPF